MADPFVIPLPDGTYAAFGTTPADIGVDTGRCFRMLHSADLQHWDDHGTALCRLPESYGNEYWAPEVVYRDGTWWMYYSVGHGINGHHIRVARSSEVFGPYVDTGVNLTPDESFAIDAHPYRSPDGRWYLYYARDVLDHDRPGTHLAVRELLGPTSSGDTVYPVLAPFDDAQIYERNREMYGRTYDWHTIEGPSVTVKDGTYWLTYSSGAWGGLGYRIAWATASNPIGPWQSLPLDQCTLLCSDDGYLGPGHNSLFVSHTGVDTIAFHAWNTQQNTRQMYIRPISFSAGKRIALGRVE